MNELQKELERCDNQAMQTNLKDLMLTISGGDFVLNKVTYDDVHFIQKELAPFMEDGLEFFAEDLENFKKSDPIVVVKLAIEEAINHNACDDDIVAPLHQLLEQLDDVTIIADYIESAKEEEIRLRNN